MVFLQPSSVQTFAHQALICSSVRHDKCLDRLGVGFPLRTPKVVGDDNQGRLQGLVTFLRSFGQVPVLQDC